MTRASAVLGLSLVLALGSDAPASEPSAGEDYVLHCSACHTPNGRGTQGLVPSLHALGPVLAHPDGRNYLVRVPGVAQAPLSDARLARLLNWVLERYSGIEANPPYTGAEVALLRAAPLRDPRGYRVGLEIETGKNPPSD